MVRSVRLDVRDEAPATTLHPSWNKMAIINNRNLLLLFADPGGSKTANSEKGLYSNNGKIIFTTAYSAK